MVILEYREATDLNVVYMEGFGRPSHFVKDATEVARIRTKFAHLDRMSLSRNDTITMIERALRDRR